MIRRTVPALLLSLTVALGAGACGAESDDTSSAPAAGGGSTTTAPAAADPDAAPPATVAPDPGPAAPVADPSPPVTIVPPAAPPSGHLDPAGTVRAWVEAVAAGDTETAVALTHVASRGLADQVIDVVDAGRAEGYSAWAGSADAEYLVAPLPAAGPGVSIVVITGTVAMEGGTAQITDAIPVRTDLDGFHQVDPFQDLFGDIGIEYEVDPSTPVPPGHDFEVHLGAGRNVSLLLDDSILLTTAEGADGDRQRVTGSADLGPDVGTHSFTVVVERDGAVQARSVLYTVAR
jgi:hypothetical protein